MLRITVLSGARTGARLELAKPVVRMGRAPDNDVAFDPNVPPQVLTFSLLTNPPGATLGASNGALAWRPPMSSVGTTNRVTVKVRDDGAPGLSATNTFFVRVQAPAAPMFESVTSDGDQLTLHVDGTEGSAVAGLRGCRIQSYADTPKPVWNPDIPQPINFFDGWQEVRDESYDNAFKAQWELFLRHVAGETKKFQWGLLEGAKGVQLAELGLKSWRQKKWLDVPKLKP